MVFKFTRYLYEVWDVRSALTTSLLDKNDDALFWAFELFYSGFDAKDCLYTIYKRFFAEQHPLLEKHFQREFDAKLLGGLVSTMLISRKTGANRLFVEFDDVAKYETATVKPAYRTLKKLVLPSIRHESLFTIEREGLKEAFLNNWLYHAAFAPIWRERLRGKVRVENRRIVFCTDEDEEAFYEDYGFEPDEQSKEIQERHVGEIKMKS